MDDQKTTLSPELAKSLDELEEAGQELARISSEYERHKQKYDGLLHEPVHRQSSPVYLVEKKSLEEFMTTMAETLSEAAARRRKAEQTHDALLSESHADNLLAWQARLHELGVQGDVLLDALATVFAEMKSIHVDIKTSEVAAEIRGPDTTRRERNLAAVLINRLPLGELRRVPWTVARDLGKSLAEIYPDPSEVQPIIHKEVKP